jgi:hypothetical protein
MIHRLEELDPAGIEARVAAKPALELAAERAAVGLERALVEPREPFAEALGAGLAALERLWELRQELPRDQVPPVATATWIRHLERFCAGDWAGARAAAEEKLAHPAA